MASCTSVLRLDWKVDKVNCWKWVTPRYCLHYVLILTIQAEHQPILSQAPLEMYYGDKWLRQEGCEVEKGGVSLPIWAMNTEPIPFASGR